MTRAKGKAKARSQHPTPMSPTPSDPPPGFTTPCQLDLDTLKVGRVVWFRDCPIGPNGRRDLSVAQIWRKGTVKYVRPEMLPVSNEHRVPALRQAFVMEHDGGVGVVADDEPGVVIWVDGLWGDLRLLHSQANTVPLKIKGFHNDDGLLL